MNQAVPVGITPRGRFWQIQWVGWLLAALIYFLAVLPTHEGSLGGAAAMKLVWALSGLAVSSVLAGVFQSLGLANRGLPRAAALAVPLAILAGLGWLIGMARLATLSGAAPDAIYTRSSFPFVASNFVLVLLVWSGGYLSLSFWQRSQEEARKSVEAASLAREAQLEMLRYQLNPHFLFNALTTVRALILERPGQAREVVTRLSEFLRYTLSRRQEHTVRVAEEIQTARDYLAIEEVRFEKRIVVDVRVDPAVVDEPVPRFVLHPLVENAVKHGSPTGGRLSIRVEAAVRSGALALEVINSGRLVGGTREGNIGLRNVRERLAIAYPGRHAFEIQEEGDQVRATILIHPTVPGAA